MCDLGFMLRSHLSAIRYERRDGPFAADRGTLLAHLSQRLIGELIVYSCSGVRRRRRPRPQFQTSSSLKPLARSKSNFMLSLLGKGERYFVRGIWVT